MPLPHLPSHSQARCLCRLAGIAGVLALTANATNAASAALDADPAWLDRTIALLDDESFAARESAEKKLISEPTLTLEEIGQRAARSGLSAEQRLRLNRAGLERFAAIPRAGLGVRFAAPNGFGGVPLGSVLENFPASKVLRAGDVVRSIDGQEVGNTNQMGALILSRLPGETLLMEIERTPPIDEAPGGIAEIERLVLDVPLGKYEDLETGVKLTPDRLGAAYMQYQRRLGLLKTQSRADVRVGASLAPLEWLRAEGYDHTAPSKVASKLENISAWQYFSFAGQPASWISPIDLRRGDMNVMNRRAMAGLQNNGLYDRLEEALAGYRAMLLRLVEIDEQLALIAKTNEVRLQRAPARIDQLKAERSTMVEGLDELAKELSASGQSKGDSENASIDSP